MIFQIGGVFTNFRMPELYSLGLGGGSLVNAAAGTVGPLSVGRELLTRAQCVGGQDLTASDVAVRAGLLSDLGSADAVQLSAERAHELVEVMRTMVEDGVDRVKVSPEEVPLLVVGGGGVLLRREAEIKGVSKVVFPENYDVTFQQSFLLSGC